MMALKKKLNGWVMIDVMMVVFILLMFLSALNIHQVALKKKMNKLNEDASVLTKAHLTLQEIKHNLPISSNGVRVEKQPYSQNLESVILTVDRPNKDNPYVIQTVKTIQTN